ncbi:hypothetical protein EIP91_007346 [Steccherinum ochraceum]|uniref:BZIP domain-containing protein n=1 Tax=Steccherinum ochraceum TaxID=92696 RepID=A0A4R0RZ04_9APHY|nr:hypothetical protein EIP91_007346 [Steccherinum ochraceum]
MTRGRRKDLTIPPSRALIQQRDYRARKAKYLSDLEQRVSQTEDENMQLKAEIAELRNRLAKASDGSSVLSSEAMEASEHLFQHLSAATSSLTRFRDIAFKDRLQPSKTGRLRTPDRPSGSTVQTTHSGASYLPSPSSAHEVALTVPPPPPLSSHFNSRASSPSISSLGTDRDSRRASSSSELSTAPLSVPSSLSSSSRFDRERRESLPPFRPRDVGLAPPPGYPSNGREAHHPFTLPPLRLPSPEDEPTRQPARPTRSYPRTHYTHHPYDSYVTSRLTPSTWSDLPRSTTATATHSRSLPSQSDDSDEDIDEDDEYYRSGGSGQSEDKYDQSYDYPMHDDTPQQPRRHVPSPGLPRRTKRDLRELRPADLWLNGCPDGMAP